MNEIQIKAQAAQGYSRPPHQLGAAACDTVREHTALERAHSELRAASASLEEAVNVLRERLGNVLTPEMTPTNEKVRPSEAPEPPRSRVLGEVQAVTAQLYRIERVVHDTIIRLEV